MRDAWSRAIVLAACLLLVGRAGHADDQTILGAKLLVATPSVTITLPAARVQAALRDRRRLVRDLERRTGPGLEGRHLMRIRRAPPDSLYAAMGLEPGDLLGTVDGRPLLDGGDPLFDALRGGGTVRLRIIRRGLVHDFEYRIE